MITIPAIDLKDGKCVQLVGGVFGSEQVVIDDIDSVALNFYNSGIKRLHIIDLNAAKNFGDNTKIIERLLKNKKCEVEVGGGIRTIEKAESLIKNGANYVIVGTSAVNNINFLKELCKKIGKEKIIVSLDYKNRKVLTHGWDESTSLSPIQIAKNMEDYCSAFLMTCVDKEGQLKGPDLEYLPEIIKEIKSPIIASGGISNEQDLFNLKKIGVYGVVVGMALYKGKINLSKVKEI
ncbi:MAG: 1-(5-phosphoribosyl)-5-[(5-phosphoribosylamino)methylideneamino]imidazole-4-carboxamide isomerase [Nanoarchaeota archaeon]